MSVTLAYPKVKILEEPEKFLLIIFSAKQALVKEDQVNKLFSRKKVIDAYESHFFNLNLFLWQKILFQLSESQLVSLLQEVSERTQKKTTVKVANQFYIPHFLILYTLTPVHIFSVLFAIHFLRCWHGEFV